MAREKLSSFNADDAANIAAAAGADERGAIPVTDRSHSTQAKKKVSGKRSGDMTGGGGGAGGGGGGGGGGGSTGGGGGCGTSVDTTSSAATTIQTAVATTTGHATAGRKGSGGNNGTTGGATAAVGQASSQKSANSGIAGNGAGNGSSSIASSGRSNKTLGWYLSDGLFQRSTNTTAAAAATASSNSSGSGGGESHPPGSNNNAKNDGSPLRPETAAMVSSEAKDAPASRVAAQSGAKAALVDEEKKRGRRARQRQSKKVVAVSLKATPEVPVETEETTEAKVAPRNDCKDDYWYYDPSSDGYYYEQMGSRGWRRRVPVGERKRLQFEQEMFAAVLRDPSAYAHIDPYGYAAAAAAAANPATFFAPQIKYYDAVSDGYYFEMPSVDGWKKRQPNSNSTSSSSGTSSNSSSYKAASIMPNFAHAVLARRDLPHATSYGAALARGQMPPSTCMISANSASLNSQDPFSSGASSRSTLSSLSEGTPTPPPLISADRAASLFADEEALDEFLAEQYDRAFDLDDLLNDEFEEWKADAQQRQPPRGNATVPSKVVRNATATYADVAAAAYSWEAAVGDAENKPPTNNAAFKRPSTLQFRSPLEDSTWSAQDTKVNERNSNHELLLNFNADKFIADLAFCGTTNTERVLRDLAALKTPVAINSQVCSLDSPHTPAVNVGTMPSWSRPIPTNANCNRVTTDDWWPSDLKSSSYIEDIWGSESSACSSGKSKLSIWRDAGLYAGVPVDGRL